MRRKLKAKLSALKRRFRIGQIGLTSRFARWRHGPLDPNSGARIVLTVRYSVHYVGRKHSWVGHSGKSQEQILAELLDEERLSGRLQFFSKILLPSLVSQDMPMLSGHRDLVVYVSEALPPKHLAALQAVLAGHDWARIVPMPVGALHYPEVGPDTLHAHLRIDDDDALSRDFLTRLSAYVRPEFQGHVITHPCGYLAGFDEAGNAILRKVWTPMVAMGMAYIVGPKTRFRSIYDVGQHFTAYSHAPTIIADNRPAYVRTVHTGQSMWPQTRFSGDPSVTPDEIRKHIEFDPEALRTTEPAVKPVR